MRRLRAELVLRAVLVLAGVLVAGWGSWLLWPQLVGVRLADLVSTAGWLLGGPLLHDWLVAPAAGLLGLLVARAVPPHWRAPVAAGLVVSGVLVLLALPALLRPAVGPPNPGLSDRNYPLGLAVAFGLVWLLVLLAGLARRERQPRLRRPPRDA